MNKTTSIFLLASIILTGCGGSSDNLFKNVDALPAREDSHGYWGFVNKKGEVVYSEEFKEEPSPIYNGFFFVKEGDGISIYKAGDKKPQLLKDCEDLYGAGYYEDGVIPVTRKGERITLIDADGNTVATLMPQKNVEITGCEAFFQDGLIIIRDVEGNYGYANNKGEVVIPMKYKIATRFSDDLAIVAKEKDDELKYSVINKKGEEVFSVKSDYDIQYFYKDGYFPIKDKNNGRYGLIDTKGELFKLPSKVHGVSEWNSKYIVFENDDNEYGLMMNDKKEYEIVIKARFDSFQIVSDDEFLVSKKHEFSVINSKGETKFEFDDDYKSVNFIDFGDVKFLAYDGSYYYLLNSKGEKLGKREFADFTPWITFPEITSDYFNVDAVVADLISEITDSGIGKYYIGEPASALGLDPKEKSYESSFSDYDLNKDGLKYFISFAGHCNEYIAYGIYDYEYPTYRNEYTYHFNPDARVQFMGFEVNMPSAHTKKVINALIEALKKKGFSLQPQYNDEKVLFRDNIGISISESYDGFVLLMSGKDNLSDYSHEAAEVEAVAEAVAVEDPYSYEYPYVEADTVVAVEAEPVIW